MRINVLGAGPAGLLFSLLIKRRFPVWSVRVFEQNPPDATFGFGVVFSRGALEFLERDVPDFHEQLVPRLESWPIQRIVHRDERVDIDGNGFSAIGRLQLNQFLQELCRASGVSIDYERLVESLNDLPSCDLLVGADGLNSLVRRALEKEFAPQVDWLTNRFAWYGTRQLFDCLTLTFRANEHGTFVAHHYRHSQTMSTFIVECDAATWLRAGLDWMSDEESRAYCERVFAPDLGGHSLVSNKSVWRQFPLLTNQRWSVGHKVLIGDALRTVHFSIGSGTRLAFEDAIALDRAFAEAGADVPSVLVAFERERRPVVEKLLAAANASSFWYERMPAKMAMKPWELAYDYMTRSGRMTDERLRELSPKFMARVDAERSGVW
ncbi:MAG: FAD-dependent monooxygenase [Deltaproteobacteria bacterium]|nr:FAD-dependent monooxygenase [Deltaproteobacteria bacterium]MBI2227474.1 FAD-dependent monooxygenase [Deltaproteobacteria bacterium]MBI2368176.1 FAD-dependent monooxygenase [Deltaproteobacteria bacterium]MBI2534674.1 FAD-dependent monooxygenase [Deltaproteobacteria bacterium]